MRVALSEVDLHVSCVVTFGDYPGETNQPYKIDWGDGTAIDQRASGVTTGTHDYAKPGPYVVTVQANDVSSRQPISVGNLAAGRAFDPLKIAENNYAVSRANEQAKAARIMGVRSHVG